MQATQPDRLSSAATASAAALTATISASSCGQSPASCTTSMLRPICGSASGDACASPSEAITFCAGTFGDMVRLLRPILGAFLAAFLGPILGALLRPIVGFDDARNEVAAHHVRSGE